MRRIGPPLEPRKGRRLERDLVTVNRLIMALQHHHSESAAGREALNAARALHAALCSFRATPVASLDDDELKENTP